MGFLQAGFSSYHRTNSVKALKETQSHSLANSHSCLTPAKNEGTDIDNTGPIVEGMINQQTIFVYPQGGPCKQKYSLIQQICPSYYCSSSFC